MTDTQATPQLVAAASRDYYPFGLEATTSSDPERMRFTGHQRDTHGHAGQTDDLDYMHARYYNPTVGRFLSPDPVRGQPEDAPELELVQLRSGNPLRYVDPDGRLFKLASNEAARAAQLAFIRRRLVRLASTSPPFSTRGSGLWDSSTLLAVSSRSSASPRTAWPI